ncbi:LPXTG cell wall anchor domain-containing protein [Staphylococcus xylosus]|uniref:LPXTG cell wall anchor domain-containing protein n=3 Tax=Staphylococcus TaxID=1279 RepID=A0A418IQJ5_STAXY|nr:LPXTG cell wall anchor domain-containing protein [Staphylococcus xylosus]TFV22344.1 LPXTG cell wall anchor domain-containing protein [Staphylococcus saprophyticus]
MVSKNSLNSNKKEDSKTLPNTGETNNQNSTILGSLFVAIGSLLLFRKRTKNSEGK